MLTKKEKHHFYAFLSRMKYINRWGLMRNTQSENVQEHSLQVAIIAHALAVIKNTYFDGNINPYEVAVCAMFHDCSEILTGDMPTPIKYMNKEMNTAYKEIEQAANNKILSLLPMEMKDDYKDIFLQENQETEKVIKAADKISAYIKCVEEEKAGNNEFRKASETIYAAIKEFKLPEVVYFMEKFIPSFYLSLDELDL